MRIRRARLARILWWPPETIFYATQTDKVRGVEGNWVGFGKTPNMARLDLLNNMGRRRFSPWDREYKSGLSATERKFP